MKPVRLLLLAALTMLPCCASTGSAESDAGALDAGNFVGDAGNAPGDAGMVWGWISAIEWNDTCDQWYMKTQWFGGVRAYFAAAPEYNRALPHTLGFAAVSAVSGACTLYNSQLMSDACQENCLCLDRSVECFDEVDPSKRWCSEDKVCINDGTVQYGKCVPLPQHFDVGTVTISGLKTPVVMSPDHLGRYQATVPNPDDLFDSGAVIQASTGGGDLPAMAFSATGVAPLVVPNNVVRFRAGQPTTISWTPADPASRVQIVLMAGSHDPNPLSAAIVCDVPDGDGKVQVAASLLDQLWYLGCNGTWMLKCSRMTRYSRDVQKQAGKEVELFVGSARKLQLLRE